MIARRALLIGLGLGTLSALLPALAEQERRVRRIGYLSGSSAKTNASWLAAFRQGMAELRWIEGRDYVIDARYANAVAQALDSLAAELVAAQPDLLLAGGGHSSHLLAQRTKTIPIVFATAQDPVEDGLASSLQRPDGNSTGLTNMAGQLGPKRMQLLREAFPRVAHVVVLFEPDTATGSLQLKEIEAAAPRLKMRVSPIELRQPGDIEPAFRRGTALGAHAYIMTQGFLLNTQHQAIADHLLRSRAPAIFASEEHAEAGGLMSYAPSFRDNFRRAAAYVDKILKGAKPGDLPIEQPVKFELVVNMKTAKALGIKFPNAILVQATKVIE